MITLAQIIPEKYFCGDDVINDVTGCPESFPSIFLYKWKKEHISGNRKTERDITKLGVHMYHGIANISYVLVWITSLMASSAPKISNKFEMQQLRQYLSYSIDQQLKISEIPMAILLAYTTFGISSGKKSFSRSLNGGRFENAKLLNKYSILHQII